MDASSKLAKTFITWLVFFNWPGLLICILLLWSTLTETVPFLGLIALLPGLLWINIPTGWLGLGRVMGESNFNVIDFGYEPKTITAWLSILVFWALVAVVMTGFTELIRKLFSHGDTPEVAEDRSEASLGQLRDSLRQ